MSGGPEAHALRLCFFTASILCTFCPSCDHPFDPFSSCLQTTMPRPVNLSGSPAFSHFISTVQSFPAASIRFHQSPSLRQLFGSLCFIPLLYTLPATFIRSSPCTTSCLYFQSISSSISIASLHPILSPSFPSSPVFCQHP